MAQEEASESWTCWQICCFSVMCTCCLNAHMLENVHVCAHQHMPTACLHWHMSANLCPPASTYCLCEHMHVSNIMCMPVWACVTECVGKLGTMRALRAAHCWSEWRHTGQLGCMHMLSEKGVLFLSANCLRSSRFQAWLFCPNPGGSLWDGPQRCW